ncbi:unnamed protein product [Microthlaspi erraticum]|uniref:CBS domain-containing protein n=1 Tax=Microthlaspi erraticum TaxID=1685480 RepID=A0A6D2IDN4_9BRAS|nr:unnamed protein product [Microthlaspi erraticum]
MSDGHGKYGSQRHVGGRKAALVAVMSGRKQDIEYREEGLAVRSLLLQSYRRTPRFEISGTFRWAPFLALQKENSFLTMLLLLSKHKMKSIPVVDLGEAKIESIITQSGVIHMFAECAGLHWFEDWGIKTLSEVRLPIMSKDHIIKIYEDEPVLQVFKLMRRKRIGGIHVVERKSEKPVGNISFRDVHFLITAP